MKFPFLSPDQIDAIHAASLHVSENAGATFLSVRAQMILANAGAIVNSTNGNMKIPTELDSEMLRKCPAEFRPIALRPKSEARSAGALEYHFTASFEMLAIHDEVFGMAKRIVEGK
jgi:trimethylamine:corrinoid methyltransferase-like protein